MEEKYLNERSRKYEDILKENEPNLIDQKISLRKSKKNEALMSKRVKLLSEKKVSDYEPKINKSELSSKVLEIYDEENKVEQKNIEINEKKGILIFWKIIIWEIIMILISY